MSEFYSPIPEGYELRRTRYVVVFGTVMSGLGKGIFSSSLGKLFQDAGYKVSPIKLEGYLNKDSGTLNPYRHGEVFVLDDGTECDMDLGTYERMLDQDLTKQNFATSGQIYHSVLEKERKGEYLGRDVQIIPHVTGEIKYQLRELAVQSEADIILVEVGGTVGDLENGHYIEALRELAFEEKLSCMGFDPVCFVALTFILEPRSLHEQKSKAAQLGIKSLMARGIQPHFIGCRAEREVSEQVKEKIAIYSNVPAHHVFSMHDAGDIYDVPQLIEDAGVRHNISGVLGMSAQKDFQYPCRVIPKPFPSHSTKPLHHTHPDVKEVGIAIIGKYATIRDCYASIIQALKHVEMHTGIRSNIFWYDTSELEDTDDLDCYLDSRDGIIIPGGFGPRGIEAKIACAKHAREKNLPYLGLCYGFQAAVIEYARNVCWLQGANTTEVEESTYHNIIDLLPEQRSLQEYGGTMRLGRYLVKLKRPSKALDIHGDTGVDVIHTSLRFRHRYEINPEYVKYLSDAGMIFSGTNMNGDIMQILELPEHPFYIGTQGHPEFRSRPSKPDPFFKAFVEAAYNCKGE